MFVCVCGCGWRPEVKLKSFLKIHPPCFSLLHIYIYSLLVYECFTCMYVRHVFLVPVAIRSGGS